MKRILVTTTALFITATSTAFANSPQLVQQTQLMLNEYGIPVDASTLDANQLTTLHSLDVSESENVAERIAEIVGYEGRVPADALTATETVEAAEENIEQAADAVAETAENTVEAVKDAMPETGTDALVESKLRDHDITVDASTLTDEQKVQILGLDLSDERNAQARLEEIING